MDHLPIIIAFKYQNKWYLSESCEKNEVVSSEETKKYSHYFQVTLKTTIVSRIKVAD